MSKNDDGHYTYRWAKWQPLMVAQTYILSVYTAYSTIVDANYSDTIGRYGTGAVGIELMTGVFINASALIAYANQWPIFFKRWDDIDRLLDIEKDEKIQRYSRRFYVGFTWYFIAQICFTIPMAAILILMPDSAPFKPGYTLAVLTYAIHWSIGLFLPELLCMLMFLAVCSRLKAVRQQLSDLFSKELPKQENETFTMVEQLELTSDVEQLRIAHQLIMDTVYHIRDILGPVLVTTCILDTIPLPLLVYSFVKSGQSDPTITVLKIEVFLSSFARVAVMCLVAQKVYDENQKVFEVLRDAPTYKMTSSSRDETVFFLNCGSVSSSRISAWGFLDVDNLYLQSVIGILIAYTITIMQFETGTCSKSVLNNANISTKDINYTYNNLAASTWSTFSMENGSDSG